jgi:hypothetical protein
VGFRELTRQGIRFAVRWRFAVFEMLDRARLCSLSQALSIFVESLLIVGLSLLWLICEGRIFAGHQI